MSITRSLLLAMVLVAACVSNGQGAAVLHGSVDLDTASEWMDTGIDVTVGTRLYIMAAGAHRDTAISVMYDSGGGPNLTSSGLFSGAAENALFGRVGTDDANIFHIGGGGRTQAMPASGRLFVQMGDGTVTGNIGHVFIDVLSDPTATILLDTSDPGGVDGWVATSYAYEPGERPLIRAFGAHRDHPTSVVWGPGGLSGSNATGPIAGVPENSLNFKVSNAGTPYYLGAGGTFPNGVTETGILYLRINDGDVTNNAGTIIVEIWDFVDGIFDNPVAAASPEASVISHVTAYPNPSSGSTSISYHLGQDSMVYGRVYDVRGRQVTLIQQGVQAAGRHVLKWDGRDARFGTVASGTYFLVIEAGGETAEKKVSLTR